MCCLWSELTATSLMRVGVCGWYICQVIEEAPLFGFEQEYTMLSKGSGLVLGWPEGGYPAPQVRTNDLHEPYPKHCRIKPQNTAFQIINVTWSRSSV